MAALIPMVLTAPAMAKTTYSQWQGKVQASCYGPYEGECVTATGKRITSKTKYIAVPREKIVSKATWKKLGKASKSRFFYYGERVQLKHKVGKRTYYCTATVEDCGGFGGCGCSTASGTWIPRMFDCTPAVFKALHFSGVATVSWRYVK